MLDVDVRCRWACFLSASSCNVWVINSSLYLSWLPDALLPFLPQPPPPAAVLVQLPRQPSRRQAPQSIAAASARGRFQGNRSCWFTSRVIARATSTAATGVATWPGQPTSWWNTCACTRGSDRSPVTSAPTAPSGGTVCACTARSNTLRTSSTGARRTHPPTCIRTAHTCMQTISARTSTSSDCTHRQALTLLHPPPLFLLFFFIHRCPTALDGGICLLSSRSRPSSLWNSALLHLPPPPLHLSLPNTLFLVTSAWQLLCKASLLLVLLSSSPSLLISPLPLLPFLFYPSSGLLKRWM